MGDYRRGFIDGSKEQSQQFQKMIEGLKIDIRENLNVPPMCQDRIINRIDELLKEVQGEKE
jgi:hypothetical protein